MSEPVSIIIPCYDAEAFVGEAIESALAQDHPSVEVVVVDDASTDDSWNRIEEHGDRVRASRLSRNGGGCHARNVGAVKASGDWLLFLDADDLLMPGTIAGLLDVGRRAPGALVACGWRYLVEAPGPVWVPGSLHRGPPVGMSDPLYAWLSGHWIPTCALLWPRSVFEAAGGWDEEVALNQDGDLAMRALAMGAPLLHASSGEGLYRRHGSGRPTVSTGALSEGKIRSAMCVLDRLERLLEGQGRLEEYEVPLEGRWSDLAQIAFRSGSRDLGCDCLRRARAGIGRAAAARTVAGRLLTRALGLEAKERVVARLRRGGGK